MPVGRPTKYKKEYCKMLIDFMAKPMPYEAFAGLIGVSRDVLHDWEKKHPEFLLAKKEAKAKMTKAMVELGMKGMMGQMSVTNETKEVRFTGDGSDKAKVKSGTSRTTTVNGFNVAAWIFMMKNMAGWRDRHEISEDDEVDSMDFDGGE